MTEDYLILYNLAIKNTLKSYVNYNIISDLMAEFAGDSSLSIAPDMDTVVEGAKNTILDQMVSSEKRQRAKKLKKDLQEELKAVFCVKRATGMHAKRNVSFVQIFSLLLLFLLGSMAGSLVLLQ